MAAERSRADQAGNGMHSTPQILIEQKWLANSRTIHSIHLHYIPADFAILMDNIGMCRLTICSSLASPGFLSLVERGREPGDEAAPSAPS